MGNHALLSASSSGMWLNCPPSARINGQFEDVESEAAKEGTLAHALCELKVNKQLQGLAIKKKDFTEIRKNDLYDKSMEEYTDQYVEYIDEIIHSSKEKYFISVEEKVDYSEYAPEGFGTADCIIVQGTDLHIVDFKYGKGVFVDAEENSQLMLYSLGALRKYELLFDVKNIYMHIFQPRLDNVSKFMVTKEVLLLWGESIKDIAKKAYSGEGELKAGKHCTFCKGKGACRARAEKNLELAKEDFKQPPLFTNDEIGGILKKAEDLASWVNDIKEYAKSQLLAGAEVKGWKLVAGKKTRKFVDADKAFDKLEENGFERELLFEKKPLSLTAVEKQVGVKTFKKLLGDMGLVVKSAGSPTMVPEEDKREALKISSAEDDFKIER